MKKFFTLIAMALMATAANAQEVVTLDFTSNAWGIPEDAKATEKKDFTNGTYTITLEGTEGNGYRFYASDQYLLIGKQGATLTLPAFSFDVEAIETVGRDKASAAVKQNIFVGDEAVSEETTGAQGTNAYKIAADKQAAGTIYSIKVTSNHNTQFVQIVIYPKGTYSTGSTPVANNISEFTALGSGTDAKLKLDGAKITYVSPDQKSVYVRDETGGMCFYNQEALSGAENTWTLGGTIEGKVSIYNGMTQMTVTDASALTHTVGSAYEPVAIDVADAASHLADLVKLNGTITVFKDGSKFYTDESKALQIYDNFKLKYAIEEGQALTNLTGVIIPYNSQIEIAPISSDITAGISSVEAEAETTAPAFNVAGQRVNSSYKGVVIRNGKKLMQK
ncbi:MAG: hypothetical protein IKH99_05425 [Prevotella sp.]|nr:hypothetical protein [Prevotella sp.]